mmetsp:Transcript_21666/g.38056  ORF Transcript_21666/g.38056 Transcript_21666/m.38056 type:complete len:282 (+) Transcript_21666:91-936(+)
MTTIFFLLAHIVPSLLATTGNDLTMCSTADGTGGATCLPSADGRADLDEDEQHDEDDEKETDLILHMQMRVKLDEPLVSEPPAASKEGLLSGKQAPLPDVSHLQQHSVNVLQASRHNEAQAAKAVADIRPWVPAESAEDWLGPYPLLAQVWKQAPMLLILAAAGVLTAMLIICGLLIVSISFLLRKRAVKEGKVVEEPPAKGWIASKITTELEAIKIKLKRPGIEDSDAESADTDEDEPEAESDTENGENLMKALNYAAQVEQQNEAVDREYAARTAYLYC